ncbi:unnamed protein product [Mytilus coruscus]|uniref:Ig-like domain-containing protein n=1 Tax=Mytilus coruscus TaxID=42192 RepID=A0A6J8BNR4_MYTCO|nr:unnamed protein product [Mytilus coruscus]
MLTCTSSRIPEECTMEFLHNNATIEILRYSKEGCYSTHSQCDLVACSCNEDSKFVIVSSFVIGAIVASFAIAALVTSCVGKCRKKVSVSLNQVEIRGPEYIKRGEHIILNCSSDDVPVGQSAEFLVNDETYTNIRVQDKECFSGISHSECLPEECNCSEDGKWYIIQLPANDDMMNVKISCTMKFTSERVSNSTIVKKIDVYGPYIKVHDELPLEVGRTTKLTCSVTTSLQDISLVWHCLNKSADMENPLPSMYSSILSLTTVADYEGSECSCTKHFVKRQYIRDLEGDVKGNKSTLILPCTYQNAGEYICTTWNDNLTRRYWSNKSTIIEVQEPPSILSDKTVKISDTISLTVEFVTSLKPFKVEWFKHNTNLTNSSAYNINMVNANITVDIYSNQIDAPGRRRFHYLDPCLGNGRIYSCYINCFDNNSGNEKNSLQQYYAAPTTDTTNTTYDTTESLYIDPIDNETRRSFTEIDRKETDRQSHDNNTDEDIPHYIEII